MACIPSLFSAFTILIIVGTLLCDQNQVMGQSCGVSMNDLISQCGAYVQKTGPKVPPSSGCCAILTRIDVPCICKYVTPRIETIISMDKVVYVARYCGKSVTPGMKCGSYVVPPA